MNEFDNLCEGILRSVDDTIEYNPEELAKGIKVEMEHLEDPKDRATAEKIAKHHLAEPGNERYYTELEKIDPHN